MSYRSLTFAVVLCACAPIEEVGEETQAAVAGTTVISLTFDDTFADNFQVGALTEARGMRATFFINSSRVGQPGSLSLAQVLALRDAGHEIAGHTITHADLVAVDTDEAKRQICNDRESLLANGFRITSFAYPFSSENAKVRQLAADCGYNSARLVGGLVVPGSCSGCPYANPMPPVDAFGVRANDSVKSDTTLERLKLYVTQAEQNGGGWVPLVFHHLCDGCNSLAVSPATFAAFLDWLEPRAAQGTVVATVDAVMGGAVKPAVIAPPSVTNMIENPSLETDANNDQIPDCWKRDSYGTNTASYSLTSNAYSGARAQRLDVTSFTSGGRRLATAQDAGTCAPAVIPGHRYTVTARYIANAQPIVSVYYRNSSGSWAWFGESQRLPTSSTFALATYTTPPLPAGATHISIGVSLISTGSLTTDQYTLVDANDGAGPSVSLSLPAANTAASGLVEIYANASDPSGVARVEFLVNGTVVGTDSTYPYWIAWDSDAFAGQVVTVAARAFDAANNSTTSSSRQISINPSNDTTSPTVALTSPADGATVSGTVTLSADASDAGGIAHVEFYANDSFVGLDSAAPYTWAWDTSAFAGQTVTLYARAVDRANNAALSPFRTVTVTTGNGTTPPTVALTSPADGATINGTVTLSANASDPDGIARVEFFVNGTLLATEVNAPYELQWNSSGYVGQTVTLFARAFDTENDAATSATHTVTVGQGDGDFTPPTVAITSPTENATVSGTVTISADATDAGGVARVDFFVNGALLGSDATAPYSIGWNTGALAGQTVTLIARAYDDDFNVGQSATRTVNVAASPANLLQNASLETDANGDQVPDCWQRGGSGTNAATYTLTSNAYAGSVAQRIDVTSLSSGARRIVSRQDTGACAPAAFAGSRYTVSARYIANATTVFTIYYRNASGSWVWFAQSPSMPTSSTYRLGTYTTAPLPAGATAISVGLSIIQVGSVTMDDFTLVEAP